MTKRSITLETAAKMLELSSYSIQHLPQEDRPRERLVRFGSEALSAVELIAIILGSGTKSTPVLQLAQLLVSRFGSLEKLAEATIQELCDIKGIGQAKAVQLRAVFSLSQRLVRNGAPSKFKIEHPVHAYNLIKDELYGQTRELFIVILQDVKGCFIGHHIVAIGTLTQALVHPREVFYPAIRHKAVSIIIAHNHPSGDLTPSTQDIDLTTQLIDAGRMVGIPVNDHLIVADSGYVSLRQKTKLFGLAG